MRFASKRLPDVLLTPVAIAHRNPAAPAHGSFSRIISSPIITHSTPRNPAIMHSLDEPRLTR